MWEALTIQTLMFFLFFQPRLLSRRRIRYVLLGFCLLISVYLLRFDAMDPFAWLYFVAGILLTYWTANKALSWVFSNRAGVVQEARRLGKEEERAREVILRKEAETTALQNDIRHVSEIYENVKEMSGSLEILDLFVNLAEAVIKNFSLKKIRLLLLKEAPEKRSAIDKVYQIDSSRLEFKGAGKNLVSKDLMYQGQAFPADLRIVEVMADRTKPVYAVNPADSSTPPALAELVPAPGDTLTALPIQRETLEGVLLVEGVRKEDSHAVAILTDRFVSEFKRIKLYEDVQRLATTDWLTGLFVRRHFFKRLDEEISRCHRFHLKFSFLMIDIDDFKAYNDKYGHLAGDALLKQTAAMIKQNVREVDLVARYGGEEFAAILLDTDAEGAMFVGQRIRKSIEKERFKIYDEEMSITVSIGLATYSTKITEGSEIVEWADSALYQAKRQGKNRVCAFVN